MSNTAAATEAVAGLESDSSEEDVPIDTPGMKDTVTKVSGLIITLQPFLLISAN